MKKRKNKAEKTKQWEKSRKKSAKNWVHDRLIKREKL